MGGSGRGQDGGGSGNSLGLKGEEGSGGWSREGEDGWRGEGEDEEHGVETGQSDRAVLQCTVCCL